MAPPGQKNNMNKQQVIDRLKVIANFRHKDANIEHAFLYSEDSSVRTLMSWIDDLIRELENEENSV
jgi:hypothetical protein